MITAGSLFSGIGGIDLAFSRAGFDIRFQVEIDAFCRKVLAKHHDRYWPHAQVYEDVKHVGRRNLEPVDVLFGGFPCTDISVAGKMEGIVEGNRSGLWFEFLRIIGELRPRYVFIENVPAITTNGGPTVLAGLAALGMSAEWGVIPASARGAPHRRERWYCVAYRESDTVGSSASFVQDRKHDVRTERSESDLRSGSGSALVADTAVEGLPIGRSPRLTESVAETGRGVESESERHGALVDTNGTRSQIERQSIGSGSALAIAGIPGDWSVEPGVGRIFDGLSFGLDGHRWPASYGQPQFDWEPPRTIEKRSIKHRGDRLKALGNAVVPQIIEPFAIRIRERIENDV